MAEDADAGVRENALPDPSVLRRLLEGATGCSPPRFQASWLEGDASDRRYFRLQWQFLDRRADGPESYTVMVRTGPFSLETDPFLDVRRYLEQIGVPVPCLVVADGTKGLIILEDLGSSTLQAYLRSEPGRKKRSSLYREAIDLLLILQSRDPAKDACLCGAYAVAFDLERFLWEVEYTREHWLDGLLACRMTPSEEETLRNQFRDIATEMLRQPQCLTHRDYHSRNLMLSERGLVVLDFQDARLGPLTYDLASLLRDSYVRLDPPTVESLLDYYLEKARERLALPWDRRALRRSLDVTSLQRNFKAIGTFAGQMTRFGNDRYLPYIPLTLAYLKRTLARYPEFQPLRDLLKRRVLPRYKEV